MEEERKIAQKWADDARDTLNAQNITGMPRSGKKSDLSDVVQTVQRMERNYRDLVSHVKAESADLIRLRNSMEELVAQLTPFQEKIITYRYVDGRSWQFIAMKSFCDEATARRHESNAVDFIAKHIMVQNGT